MDWSDMESGEYNEYEDRSSEEESEGEDIEERCNKEDTWVTEAINRRIFLTQEGKKPNGKSWKPTLSERNEEIEI